MIGVVGGGIAGLAAARRLQSHGLDVQVFEASDQVGGSPPSTRRPVTPSRSSTTTSRSPNRPSSNWQRDLGLGEDVEWRIGKNAYYVDGTVHSMDAPWEILAFPHWSLYDKFRLGMLTLDVDVRGGVPKFDTYERLEDFEDVSALAFAKEHTTENVYRTFFEPLLDAKFGERKEDVSAAWLLGRIKFRGERDILKGEILGYLDGGFWHPPGRPCRRRRA